MESFMTISNFCLFSLTLLKTIENFFLTPKVPTKFLFLPEKQEKYILKYKKNLIKNLMNIEKILIHFDFLILPYRTDIF